MRLLDRLPLRRRDWRLIASSIRTVLGVPRYAAVGLLAAVAALTAFVLSQNLRAVNDLLLGSALPLDARLTFLLEQYPLIGARYGPLSSTVLVTTAALVGIDVALLAYQLREQGVSVSQGSGSVMGVALGTLGAGCAACGSAILAGVLSLLGLGGVLAVLPLHGLETAFAAMVILVLSIYWLADGMRGEGGACRTDHQ